MPGLLEAAAIVLFLAWFFYRSPLALAVLLPLGIPVMKRQAVRTRKKKERELAEQFKEAMNSVLMALRAGYSAENAFRESEEEMSFLFGGGSLIRKELGRIGRGLDNHIPLEKLLQEFAGRYQVEEITEFSEVFGIAKRSGGNMAEILSRTISLIQSRMDVEAEIRVMISEKRMEQKIMNVVPFAIVIYIGMTSPGFFDVLYHNASGIVVMSVCLLAYLTAFLLAERIMTIRI